MADSMAAHWLGLSGQLCVVTGGAGGLGRAIAAGLAQAGARLVLLDRDQAACDDAARALGDAQALPIACDIADADMVAAVAAHALKDAGPCDVLVNNAGLLRAGPIATLSLAEWNALLAVNLTGYFLCAQAFGRQMLDRGKGAIVHTASIASRHPQPFSGAYSVSKAGVVMLSQQLAVEWGPHGVRSNVVSPGLVRTPMSEAFYQAPGVAERRAAMVPVGRVAAPVDIAEVALFLASDRAGYVNGEDICIDGGFGRTIMGLVPRPGYDRADH
jgi:NAD(P)-dependent dehydrogenase (short-subunit alcohol dehydrogenase family)